jgi:uncharacterized DUF497 family protein
MAWRSKTLRWYGPTHGLIKFDRWEDGEERWHAVGFAGGIALLVLIHTYPGEDESVVRIVGARRATRNERTAYVSSND